MYYLIWSWHTSHEFFIYLQSKLLRWNGCKQRMLGDVDVKLVSTRYLLLPESLPVVVVSVLFLCPCYASSYCRLYKIHAFQQARCISQMCVSRPIWSSSGQTSKCRRTCQPIWQNYNKRWGTWRPMHLSIVNLHHCLYIHIPIIKGSIMKWRNPATMVQL